MKRELTQAEKATFVQMWKGGHYVADIKTRFQMSGDTLRRIRKELGLPGRATPVDTTWTPERVDAAHRLYIEAGMSAADAGAVLGVSRNAIIGLSNRRCWEKKRVGPLPELRAPVVKRAKQAGAFNARRGRPAKAPPVARSHVRPPKPGKQKRPGAVLGATFIEGPDSDKARAAFRKEGLSVNEFVFSGAGVDSPNARPFIEARSGCKWPLGDRHEVRSCCNPVARGSYCAGHAAVGYIDRDTLPSKERTESRVRSFTRFDRVETVEASPPEPSIWDEAA